MIRIFLLCATWLFVMVSNFENPKMILACWVALPLVMLLSAYIWEKKNES